MAPYIITETSKARVCFMNVPDAANRFEITKEKRTGLPLFCKSYNGDTHLETEILPSGRFNMISRLSQVSEEKAAGIVDIIRVNGFQGYNKYNQKASLFPFVLAKNSLRSLARSLNIPIDQDPVVLIEPKK